MNNYANIIRNELANNSRGKQQHVERDYSRLSSSPTSAWDEAPDAFFVEEEDDNMDAGFFFSADNDDDDNMQCMFFNN